MPDKGDSAMPEFDLETTVAMVVPTTTHARRVLTQLDSEGYAVMPKVQVEALQRRCEVYAAGLVEVATYEGQYGLGYETPKRVAQQTIDRAAGLNASSAEHTG